LASVEAVDLRATVGGCDSKGLLVPRIGPDDVVINPVRPLYEVKWSGQTLAKGKGCKKWKRGFSSFLMTHFGLSVKDTEILCGRSNGKIVSIIRNVECLLDNFLLFDRTMFVRRTDAFKALIRVVRITIRLSCYSFGDMIKKWKDFVNHFTNLASKAKVEENISMKYNPYAFLLSVGKFKDILEKEISYEYAQSIAHIISTRNLANGGETERRKAQKEFIELTSKPFEPHEAKLHKLYLVSKRLGKICSTLRGTDRLSGGHISLNSAGTLDMPVKHGGKAADAVSDCNIFLNEVVAEGETRHYPWGSVYYPSGEPRWRAFGPLEGTGGEFLGPADVGMIDRERLNGLNAYTGMMVYVTAYEFYSKQKGTGEPIPIRQCTVTEPGGKARIVTTGPWWLTVLQQPAAHELREHIAYHPAAYSCMIRADQCWQSLRVWEKLHITSLGDEYEVLSSDLKSATDAIPHTVARTLLKGFLEAINCTKWSWIIDFIGERDVFPEGGLPVYTLQRGVMMGEPLSKVCLILLGLAIEELAFSEYNSLSLTRISTPSTPWRAFHLGGDDHLAVGPAGYLRSITAYHRSYGSLISPSKHRRSKIFVVYTEKILFFVNRQLNKPVWEVTRNPGDSIFVDSMKLRLLSPFTKATETCNDKNIAIGKVKSAARTLEYIESMYLKKFVVDRLRYKFRDFVKGTHHRTICAVTSLPTELGGLGLCYNSEYLKALPPIWNKALRTLLDEGAVGTRVRSLLGNIFRNSVPRGVQVDNFVTDLVDQILDYPDMVEAKSLTVLLAQEGLEDVSFRRALHVLRERHFVSIPDLPGIAERPYLFHKLLIGEGGKSFRTEPVKDRIRQVWSKLEELTLNPNEEPLSEAELKRAREISKSLLFVNLEEKTTLALVTRGEYDPEDPWISADFQEVNLRQAITFGEPSMTVSFDGGG